MRRYFGRGMRWGSLPGVVVGAGLAAGCTAGSGAPSTPIDPGPGPVPQAPVLDQADARQVGRFGEDVVVTLVGWDAEADTPSAVVSFLDETGAEVSRFDSDGDGRSDTGTTVLPLDAPLASAEPTPVTLTLRALVRDFPQVASLRVALEDGGGLRSEPIEVAIVAQAVLALDALCDPTFVESRCADGLACRGEAPAVCVEGEAPALEQVAYYADELGVRVLVQGADPDDDVAGVTVAFLDALGQDVMLDLDGDGAEESTSFPFERLSICEGGTCFFRFDTSDYFGETVDAVRVVAVDRGGRETDPVEAARATPPVRGPGSACDPHGFDRCRDSVCNPGVPGATNRCTSYSTARTAACREAPVVAMGAGTQSLRGTIASPSLWDPPTTCASNDPRFRPEGVVKLVLDRDVPRLVLSTNNAYTSFDTVLYLFRGCDGEPVVAWCADDTVGEARGWLAKLDLADVPAGEYMVVVDAFAPAPDGRFQLDVTAE